MPDSREKEKEQEHPAIDLAKISIRHVLLWDLKKSPERFVGKHVAVPRFFSAKSTRVRRSSSINNKAIFLWHHGIFVHDRYNPAGFQVMDVNSERGLGFSLIDRYAYLTYEGATIFVVDYPSETTAAEATMRRVEALHHYNQNVAPFSYHVEDSNCEVFPTFCTTGSHEAYAHINKLLKETTIRPQDRREGSLGWLGVVLFCVAALLTAFFAGCETFKSIQI
jgi:hypothetical protein